jgi:hypothetical protein
MMIVPCVTTRIPNPVNLLVHVLINLLEDMVPLTTLVRLFNLLKPLLIEGPGWPFGQPFNKKTSRDGRAAFLCLKRQAEGTAAIASRKVSSYNVICNTAFTGRSGSYSLAKYIALHQKVHNKLLSLGEPVLETKKVTDFLAGITGEVLSMSKDMVADSPTKNTNFEACQQFLKAIIFSKSQCNEMTNNHSVKGFHQD